MGTVPACPGALDLEFITTWSFHLPRCEVFEIPLISRKVLSISEESVVAFCFHQVSSARHRFLPLFSLPGSKNAQKLFHQIQDNIPPRGQAHRDFFL